MTIRITRTSLPRTASQKRSYLRKVLTLFVAAGLSLSGTSLFAQQWAADVDGSWEDTANWDNNIVPGLLNEDVSLNAASIITGNQYAVTYASFQTIQNLTIGNSNATLNHTGGTLTVTGTIDATEGTYNLTGVISGGTIASGSNIQFNGGGLDSVDLRVGAASSVSDFTGLMYTSGTTTFSDDGGTFTNNGGTIEVSGTLGIASNFVNQGTLNATSGSTVTLSGTWDNQGSGQINATTGSTINLAGTAANPISGPISITGDSVLNINQNLSMNSALLLGDGSGKGAANVGATNTLTLESTSVLTMGSGTINSAGSTINNGVVNASGVSVLSGSGSFTNNGTLEVTSATLGISSGFVNTSSLNATVGSTVTLSGTWDNQSSGQINASGNSTIILAGTAANPITGAISIDGSTLNINQNLTTNSNLQLTSSTANVDTTRTFTIGSGGSVTLDNSTLESIGSTINDGTVNSFGSSELSGTGVFTNNGTLAVTSGQLTVSGEFANTANGVVNAENPSVVVSLTGAWTNDGILNTSNGARVALQGTGTNNGTLNVGAGSAIEVFDMTTFTNGSILMGEGTLINQGMNVSTINGMINPGSNGVGTFSFFNGAFELGSAANTNIEIGGDFSADQIDAVFSSFKLGGFLNVSLIPGYTITGLNEWTIITRSFNDSSTFSGLMQDGKVGNFGSYDLFIDYAAGGGSDVRLYSQITAVPEPSSLALLGIASITVAGYRRFRRKSAT